MSRHVQLESVELKSAVFESFAEPGAPAVELEASIQYKAGYTLRPGHVHVRVEFQMEAESQGASEHAAELKAQFVLSYTVPESEEFADDALQYFAELNGTYNAWPYWRELVHTVSGRAGLAAIVVPVFRPAVRELQERSEADPVSGRPKGSAPTADPSAKPRKSTRSAAGRPARKAPEKK